MTDIGMKKLAKSIVEYSLDVKKGEKVLIFGNAITLPYITEVIKLIELKKAKVIPIIFDKYFEYNLIKKGSKKEITKFFEEAMPLAKQADCVIDIDNEFPDFSRLDEKNIELYGKLRKPFWDYLVYDRTGIRRITILFPLNPEAEMTNMSLKDFEKYFYKISLLNWKKLTKKYQKLMEILKNTKKVELIGENVDLKMEIIGKYAVMENGKENIPGGEIYMAPVKKSLNGWIKFEYPLVAEGKKIKNIYLRFKEGKIVKYSASSNLSKLKSIIETDKGSKYIGEFGIGINPNANKVTNLWFDEKNISTIHLAIGKCYWENHGENDSAVHWDIIKDMRKAKIIFDGKVIQDKGKWLI